MRRLLSPRGLAAAVWVSCLAFEGLLAGMTVLGARHLHFLPLTPMLGLVFVAGLALVAVASWRVVRGPDRRRALSWLLVGAAPLWFVAGHFVYGLAFGYGRNHVPDPGLRLLEPLRDAVMDLERGSDTPGHPRREGRHDLGTDARGRGPGAGRRDGPARPGLEAAGPPDRRDDPMGAGLSSGSRRGRPGLLHGDPAGRGVAGDRRPRPDGSS